MTFKEFKGILESRVTLLGSMCGHGIGFHEANARHEEAETILEFANRVTDDPPPLYSITIDEHGKQIVERVDEAEPGIDRHDPGRC